MGKAMAEVCTRIEPAHGWRGIGLGEVWEYRDLLYFLTWRELKSRYRQMALGPFWLLLIPVANMVVFSMVFGQWGGLPSDGLPHPVYYLTALLPWQYFSVSATKSTRGLVDNLSLLSKVYFPRILALLSGAVVGIVDFLFSLVVLLAIMAWYGLAPASTSAFLPLYLLLAVMTALTVGLWLASVAVWFRDVAYGVGFLMQVWMFATVVYPSASVPQKWRMLYRLNPMQTVVEGFRWCLTGHGQAPDGLHAFVLVFMLALLVGGAMVFRRTERAVVDVM